MLVTGWKGDLEDINCHPKSRRRGREQRQGYQSVRLCKSVGESYRVWTRFVALVMDRRGVGCKGLWRRNRDQ